jgi:hypothetical protein
MVNASGADIARENAAVTVRSAQWSTTKDRWLVLPFVLKMMM